MTPDLPVVPSAGPRPDVEPVTVRRFAAELLAAAVVLQEAEGFTAGAAVATGWHGAAATAYHASLARPRADLAELAERTRRVVRACEAYARTTDALLEEFDDVLEARRRLVEERAGILRAAAHGLTGATDALTHERAEEFRRRLVGWQSSLAHVLAGLAAADRALAHGLGRPWPPGPGGPELLLLATRSPLVALVPDEQRRRWWAGLTVSEQDALVLGFPMLVGAAGGLPAVARDRANRLLLSGELVRLRARADPRERRRLRRWEAVERALREADRHRDPVTGAATPALLWLFDPEAFGGDGAVAIAVGDLDAADHVVVQVPGFGNDLGTIDGLITRMADLYDAARREDPGSTTAAMIWSGYDAPDNLPDHGLDALGVVGTGAARAGGRLLARDLERLLGSRTDDPHLTVVGHSYGSTVVALGSSGPGLPGADDTVLLGSPGVGSVGTVEDLGAEPAHVWVGRDSHDPVTWLGDHGLVAPAPVQLAGLGRDPADARFGATRFTAEAPELGTLPGLAHHSSYFQPGSEAMDNLAHVVVGEYQEVEQADPVQDPWWSPPHDPEGEWDPGRWG